MEKISSQREWRKWSLGLGHNWKTLGLTCVRSQSSREINNATISWFSTFLTTISFTVSSFLPYLRLAVKIFQFLRLSTKFLVVLRLSVNSIETLVYKHSTQMRRKKIIHSGAPRERSGAPWIRKFGNLPIREILVITWPYARTTVRPHHRYTNVK